MLGPKIKRKRAEGLKLKSKSYFIWARIPQRHASNLRNLQGLNPEVLESYNGYWPYYQYFATYNSNKIDKPKTYDIKYHMYTDDEYYNKQQIVQTI